MVLVTEKSEILDAAAMEEIHFGVDSRCMNVVYLNKMLRTLRAFMRTVQIRFMLVCDSWHSTVIM